MDFIEKFTVGFCMFLANLFFVVELIIHNLLGRQFYSYNDYMELSRKRIQELINEEFASYR